MKLLKLSKDALSHWLAAAFVVAIVAAAGVTVVLYVHAATQGIVPPSNPSSSIWPNPDFFDDCAYNQNDNSSSCVNLVIAAINNARSSLESMPGVAINLPAFGQLTNAEQIFVITNIERVDRGLPPVAAMTNQLDSVAQTGINNETDPILSGSVLTGGTQVYTWRSNWAGPTTNSLGADYFWMYDDGYGNPLVNSDCSSPGATGCWGHRGTILDNYNPNNQCSNNPNTYMGSAAGVAPGTGQWSYDEIVVGGCGTTPTDEVFTWAQALGLSITTPSSSPTPTPTPPPTSGPSATPPTSAPPNGSNNSAQTNTTSTSPKNTSNTTQANASPTTPTTYTISPPSSTTYPVVLWNGTNFGVSGQTLTPGNSVTTSVGITNNNNIPLALVNVNLTSNLNWSSAGISYATNSVSHKSYVHGLTNAAGINNSTFTLYVPYAIGDRYVGVCPGATSLVLVGPNCPGIYYLSDNQSKTHSNTSSIAKGTTVTAVIDSVGALKYWAISGLNGTGGFSTNTLDSNYKVSKATDKNKASSLMVLSILSPVILVLIVLGTTYRLWLPKLKKSKPGAPDDSSGNPPPVNPI